MLKTLINLAIYIVMMALIYASEFMGNQYAGNLAIFLAWFFIVIGFIALFVEPKKLFSQSKVNPIVKSVQYLMILLMVIVGWTVTGTIYFFIAVIMHISTGNIWKKRRRKPNERASSIKQPTKPNKGKVEARG